MDVEVFGERSTSRRIKVFRQEVEQLTAARRRGVGLRVFRDGAVGHAYTSDLSEDALDDLVRRALEQRRGQRRGRSLHGAAAAAGRAGGRRLYDSRLAAATDAQRIAVALEVEAAALAADRRVKLVEDTLYADGDGEVFIVSTAGVRRSYRAGQCYAFAYVLAEEEGQVGPGYSYGVGRALEDLDPGAVGAEAAGRAARLLGARKCPSMRAPVILDPFVSAAFFGVLSSALTADAVQKGRIALRGARGREGRGGPARAGRRRNAARRTGQRPVRRRGSPRAPVHR